MCSKALSFQVPAHVGEESLLNMRYTPEDTLAAEEGLTLCCCYWDWLALEMGLVN